jgi:amino acid adenylation domain-containing protein
MKKRSNFDQLIAAASQYHKEKKFWLEKLSGELRPGRFPYDHTDEVKGRCMEILTFEICGNLFARLLKVSSGSDIMLHMILDSAIIVLIDKYTGSGDILTGTPIYKQEIEGEFVNTVLVLRNRLEKGMTFKKLLIQFKQTISEAVEHANYPIETLLYHLDMSASENQFPLFDVAVLLENIHDKDHLKHIPNNMTFGFKRAGERIEGNLQYNSFLFDKSTIERIITHFKNLLQDAIFNVDKRLSLIEILSEAEKKQILVDFNDNMADFFKDKSIPRFIEEHAKNTPDCIALVFEGHQITYREFTGRANQVSNFLDTEMNIQPEEPVGIFMDRSINMVIAILGTWKSGVFYIPIDASSPGNRIITIINNAKIGILFSEKKYIKALNNLQWECKSFHTYLCMDSMGIYSEKEQEENILMDKELWDSIVEKAENEITEGGWLSSYTREPLAPEIMDEYSENFLEKIKPIIQNQMRVLEIGCGSGLTMFKIAPHVGYYLATDISSTCIERNKKRVIERGHQNIALACMPAHDIDTIENKNFDLIIMNSVVQSFHGHNYLRQVIGKSIDLMAEKGYLLIGDILDLDTKEELIQDLENFKREKKNKNYETLTDRSAELFLCREFFEDLVHEFPAIRDVLPSGKIYTIKNELSLFRYDVLIEIDKTQHSIGKSNIKPKHKYQYDSRILKKFAVKKKASNKQLANPHHLAYVIYTSGSTGKPKGVMVEHIGMMNHIRAKINDLHLSAESVVAQNAHHTFDISVWQFFTALIPGGKTVIYPNRLVLEVVRFINRIIQDRVTILEVVPSYLSVILETLEPGKFRSLDYLIVTGEALKPDLVTRWFEKFPYIKMVNAYGPTEASDDITHHIMDKPPAAHQVPIGKPVQNFNIYIVDENMQLCPLRVKGEICVSGIGVGRGYLNNPELTKDKFLSSLPIFPSSHLPNFLSLYRTGDLGSWLPDGTIEFFGRKDHQVKIRGFRIELGEIETQLETHSHVKEAVVVDREEKNGNKYLCAYLVMRETLNVSEIKVFLSERLPDYMVPTQMIELKEMPLTPNGKIDRSALPGPVGETAAGIAYITEEMLKSVEIPTKEKTGGIGGSIGEELEINEEDRLTREEKHRLLYSFNDTKIDYPSDKTLHRLFEEQVERSPDAVSVVYEDRRITYKELNRQANRSAWWLRSRGLQNHSIVGLLLDRSIELMEAIFAVLKAGGTYMPLEIDTPKDRMISLLEDSQASMLLTSSENIKSFEPYGFIKLQNLQRVSVKPDLTQPRPQLTQLNTLAFPDRSLMEGKGLPVPGPGYADTNLQPPAKPFDLAYVIFTSGSTGRPKGVMIENRAVVNFIKGMTNIIDFTANDVILSLITVSFDIFVLEALLPLTGGCKVVIGSMEQQLDTRAASSVFNREQITIFQGTPSMVQWLIADHRCARSLTILKYLLVGGEVFPGALLEKLRKIVKGKIINVYGPTETTVWSTSKDVSGHQALNIGKPIANTQIYILGRTGVVQPIGVTGELWIGGHGVARGYLNRVELTAGKFEKAVISHSSLVIKKLKRAVISHSSFVISSSSKTSDRSSQFITNDQCLMTNDRSSPLSPNDQCPVTNDRLYHTGDLARWQPDGNIEFLGRMDHQVKIRGLRIELEEIENLLLEYRWIDKAAVVVKEHIHKKGSADDGGDKYLYAYFVTSKPVSEGELRTHLSGQLPPYMIPTGFAQLEKMPLTTTGKIDRKTLELVDIKRNTAVRSEGPRNEVENRLAEIWSDVLGVEKKGIGIHSNFFDLGGHSLKAVYIMTRTNKEFSTSLPVSMIFKKPSIAEIAESLAVKKDETHLRIEKCPINDYYPLSHAQKRLWFFHQIEPGNPAYNLLQTIRFTGDLEIDVLGRSMVKLIQRHESLRTSIKVLEDSSGETGMEELPIQIIYNQVEFKLDRRDISNLPQKEKEETLHRLIEEEGKKPFDLARAPIFRMTLLTLGPQEHVMIFVMHHIISDAWSMRIMIREFGYFYDRLKRNLAGHMQPLELQYKDFAYWQNKLLSQNKLKGPQEYWHQKLCGELPVLELHSDYPRPTWQSFKGDKVLFQIDTQLTAKLKALAKKETSTIFMVLTAAFKVLLYRYTNCEDFLIGTLTAGRSDYELKNIIGYFINILALRDVVKGEWKFDEFLRKVRKTTLDAYDNQDYPFDKLVDELQVKRNAGRSPVFDIMLAFQNYEDVQYETSLKDLGITPIGKDYVVSKYDLYLDIIEMPGQLTIHFEFCSDLYKKETIQRMVNHYLEILYSISNNQEQVIAAIEMISAEEKKRLLIDFNDTRKEFPYDECYHDLFQQQAAGVPEKIACKHNSETITYRQLNSTANRIAHYLIDHGIKPGMMVALLMKRSIRMLASIIGIFKAGGVYVPIEVEYPDDRIRFMLCDAEPGAVVVDPETRPTIQEMLRDSTGTDIPGSVYLDSSATLEAYPGDNLPGKSTPNDCAYMIYTSGSTGKPKGVLIHRRGMINHLYAKIHDLSINGNDRIAQTASVSFDISVWQFLAALPEGGTTVIFDYDIVLNPGALLQGLQEEKITIFESVPSLMSVFLEMLENKKNTELKALRWMIPTGEALKPPLVQQWFKYYPNIKLLNAYGPTEASDDITHYVINSGSDMGELSVPIGKPVQNMKIYILDKNLSLCPIGVRGEICTAGLGVGKGYWKNPGKTREVFIKNPYAIDDANQDYAVLYKTGDIGYFREDGNIECLGRIDNQVKIRGFRIELEEIETVMSQHPSLNECAVVIKKEQYGTDSIVGFLVEKESVDIEELKRFLLGYLPNYMVPSAFVKLDKLPLTISGKTDRQALAAINIDAAVLSHGSKENYTAPGTRTERQIARVWSEALKLEHIGIHDNFFELGGHSLLIPRVFQKLDKMFPGKIQIGDLFDYLTIHKMAMAIDGTAVEEEDEIIELDID